MSNTPARTPRRVGWAALFAEMAAVLDPIATQYRGESIEVLTARVRRAWRLAFDTELPRRTLRRCAAAIHHGTPWALELWSDGWDRPEPARPGDRRPARLPRGTPITST